MLQILPVVFLFCFYLFNNLKKLPIKLFSAFWLFFCFGFYFIIIFYLVLLPINLFLAKLQNCFFVYLFLVKLSIQLFSVLFL